MRSRCRCVDLRRGFRPGVASLPRFGVARLTLVGAAASLRGRATYLATSLFLAVGEEVSCGGGGRLRLGAGQCV